MNTRFTKIICAILSAVVAFGIVLVAGCSEGHTDKALGGSGIFTDDKAVSNGGFAVEKGDYIYFINGVQNNSANNDYGTPVKGAVNRISKTDFAAHNYANTQTVVPLIAYSSNHDTGIFVYGDSVYYGTPSTAKDTDGSVQYQNLEMQSTKLDRSKTTAPYIRFSDSSYDYRYVQAEDGTVYLLYVATGEKLYGESSGVTNIHSLNTKSGKNTLLAYNVTSYLFDAEEKTNTRIYYTMNVWNETKYNQVYTVTADVTEANEYDTSDLIGWTDDDHYVNCGQLVFEGIGGKNVERTPFNYQPENPEDPAINENDSYTYKLYTYLNGTLIFTRSNEYNSGQYLYTYKDGAIDTSNPIQLNVDLKNTELLKDGSRASDYKYLFNEDGSIKAVLYAESDGGVSINYVYTEEEDASKAGTLHDKISKAQDSKYFKIVPEGTSTLLWVDAEREYLYYSVSGSVTGGTTVNDHSVWRISYASDNIADYQTFMHDEDYSPVQIFNVDTVYDWYMPEIIENQLLYASASSDMTLYTYVMACDLRNESGELMSNAELKELKELYDGIEKIIGDTFGDAELYPTDKYDNIQNILRYGFYTGDSEYIKSYQKKANATLKEDEILLISDETLEKYLEFLTPTEGSVWEDYTGTKTVNGKTVYATNRNYYFSMLGKMNSSDAKGYKESLVKSYLPSYKVNETTWWEGLSTVAKVFFIIGMCLSGLLVISCATGAVMYAVQHAKKGETVTKRRRIKVDTTDDKSIDVYNN